MALDPRIEAIREQYGLAKDDFWQIPQNKAWVCKHAALEVVSVKAGVEWSMPQIIEAHTENGIAVMAVSGKLGSRTEWSTGEATPKNNKNAYPWAMAEKRAKDRVILKLVGLHGLVYSEDEMPPEVDTSLPKPEVAPTTPKAKARGLYAEMQQEVDVCSNLEELRTLWTSAAFQFEFKKLPKDWQEQLTERKDSRRDELQAGGTPGYVAPEFD
jgi:hypothetical protein